MFNYLTAGPGGGPLPRLDSGASPTDYPYGKCKNDDPSGSGNGTPIQIETLGDTMQALYACLVNAGITPNGVDENVNNSDLLRALKNMFFSVGDLKFHYGDSSPSANWLICDGSAFNPVDYPELSVFLGGSTLPDFRGRVVVGKDASDADFDTIGEEGGAKVHALTVAETADHAHVIPLGGGDGAGVMPRASNDIEVNQGATLAKGDGDAHNNLQPYKVVLVLIKAK